MSHVGVPSGGRRGSNTGSGGMCGPTAGCNVTLSEEQQQQQQHHPPATGSSPPGQHHPPNSLSLQSTGAQVKKKSGFQITSVLPAQVSASTNNSIADDTESYDDMDESHTEDLSSSDILDVSVSRATDTGIPERSSSEETLNSLHGGETPGVGSPNEPVKQQSLSQGYMVNGTVHHTRHAQEHNKDQAMHPVSSAQTGQGRLLGSASVASSASAMSPAIQSGAVIQGRSQRSSSIQAAGVDVSAAGLVTTAVTSASLSTSATPMLGGGVVVAAATSGNMPGVGSVTQPATGTTQIPASTASRFRVVKLDSSSEPFRKGRWMCTEFYEKEAPPPPLSTDTAVHHRTVESFIQSESETTSGSSSCSTMSGGADPGTQPIQQTFTQTGPHIGLSQATPQQLHPHPQDPGVHSVSLAMVSPNNPQVVPGPLGMEGQPPTSRAQQQVLYPIDSQTRQVPNAGFSANQQPTSVPVSQGVQHVEYTQISQTIQAPGVVHQIPPVQAGVAPMAASIATLPVGPPPVAVPQALSPRPQGSAPQMLVVAQGSTINQAPQHSPQIAPEQQQQAAGGQSPHVTTLPTAKPAPTMSPTSIQSNLQAGLPQTLQHGAPVPGHTSVLGLGLNHPGAQSPQLSLGRGPYGMVSLTASKLEDAGRLLLQHPPLLSLPRLAAGGMCGLIGQTGTEMAAALCSVGETGASATAAGFDEDSSSGASVVAIDNKIEQAMDLVKSHLMCAVREEVEVLKEQIKELIERNLQLEQENILLRNLSSPEQMAQFHAQVQSASPTLGTQSTTTGAAPTSQPPGPQGPPV